MTISKYELESADDSLKKDKEFVLAAVKSSRFSIDYSVLEFAHDSLKKDKEFVLAAVRIDGIKDGEEWMHMLRQLVANSRQVEGVKELDIR